METIQNIKEELIFFAVTESINWNYDLSQENHRYCYGLSRKCTYHHSDVSVAHLRYIGV